MHVHSSEPSKKSFPHARPLCLAALYQPPRLDPIGDHPHGFGHTTLLSFTTACINSQIKKLDGRGAAYIVPIVPYSALLPHTNALFPVAARLRCLSPRNHISRGYV